MERYNTNEITKLIRNRRSIFPAQYSGEIVKKEIVEEMLENANWAPTHKLTEPWRFTVFSGEGLKKLANFQAETYKTVAMENDTFNAVNYEKLQTKPLLASHIIAIGMKRDEKELVPEIEEVEAVACAVQNMYLTATAHGVGCYWGSGGVTYFEEAKAFFGLGSKDKLLGFMYIGIPKDVAPKSRRNSIDAKVSWVE